MEGVRGDDSASYPLGCLRRGGVRPDLHEVCSIDSDGQRTPRASAARGSTTVRSAGVEKRYQCRFISAAPKWFRLDWPAIGRDQDVHVQGGKS